MTEHKRLSVPTVGGSSLLVIFSVLCLTVFALLSLSTVLANDRLSDAAVQASVDYYAADAAAEEIFARLRNGERPDNVDVSGGEYRYVCPISDTQNLQVCLEREGDLWRVLRWQAVPAEMAAADETLTVWDGETTK